MKKVTRNEVSLFEFYNWFEVNKGIHWNASCDMFSQVLPYDSYEDFYLCDLNPRDYEYVIEEYHKPYALIREFMLCHRVREMRVYTK